MTDGPDRTTARLDEDIGAWVLSESPAGPGGALAVEAAFGVLLRVDAADPLRIVELVVELPYLDTEMAPTADALGAVTALLGPAPAEALVPDRARGATVFDLPVDPATAGQRRLLGRLAVLDDLRSASPPLAGWWAAEAALLCARADARLRLSNRALAEARSGAATIAGLDLDDLPPSLPLERVSEAAGAIAARVDAEDPATAGRLRLLVTGFGSRPERPPLTDEQVEEAFEQLLGRGLLTGRLVDETAERFRDLPAAAPGLVEGSFALGAWLVDDGQLDAGIVTIPGTGHFTWNRDRVPRTGLAGPDGSRTLGPAEMVVRIPLESGPAPALLEQLWLRVYEVRTGNLVAICPLGADPGLPGWGLARLAVPRHFDVAALALDVTKVPTRAPDGSYTRTIRRASALTRAATAAERLGWWGPARLDWERCAEEWASLGDRDRQAVSLAFAAQNARRADDRIGASTLLAAARSQQCAWAGRLLDAPRDVAQAFMAETPGLGQWLSK